MNTADGLATVVALATALKGPNPHRDIVRMVATMDETEMRAVVLLQSVVIASVIDEFARALEVAPEQVMTMFASQSQLAFGPGSDQTIPPP